MNTFKYCIHFLFYLYKICNDFSEGTYMKFQKDNLLKIREKMKREGLASFVIVTGDPHNSEEPASYFKEERMFACPFTGDNAIVLVTKDEAFVWTDGRFFISAEIELKDSGVKLMKYNTPGYPTLFEYLKTNNLYPVGSNLAVMPFSLYKKLSEDGAVIDSSLESLFEHEFKLSNSKLFDFNDSRYQKYSRDDKVNLIREALKKENLNGYVFSSLDDIAWITNLRGDDINCTPLFYSYMYIDDKDAILFVNRERINIDLGKIQVRDYNEIFNLLEEKKVLKIGIDTNEINAKAASILKNSKHFTSPARSMKCIKNDVEIENIKSIQEEDGVALVKFIYLLNKNKGKRLSEYELAEILGNYRKEGERFIEDSFPTISACGSNAAMMHYSATKDKFSFIEKDTIELLVDSGGQYYGGTTDTTRTFLVGKPTEEYILDYTLTLKSVINLTTAVFLEGTSGATLDMLARDIMWKHGMDYKCGTGHGVGYLSVVHEPGNGFGARRGPGTKILPGMVTTVEPGVYKEGKYGIRIENNLLCVRSGESNGDNFLKFETITYVPIDLSAVDFSLLTKEEIKWINDYHRDVYEHLKSYFKGPMLQYLRQLTKPVFKKTRVLVARKG